MDTSILITQRLALKRVDTDEAQRLFELIEADRRYLNKWLPWVKDSMTASDSLNFVKGSIDDWDEGKTFGWGIYVDGKLSGHMSLRVKSNREPEIGYWLASDLAGHGFTTSAVKKVSAIGLGQLNLPLIRILADPANAASNKVAQKAGYKLIGQEDSNGKSLNVWVLK